MVVADAEAEDDDEHPVARSDRQQVEGDRLQRQQHRAERAQQEHVGQPEDREDDPRERREDHVQEVDSLRWRAAGDDLDAGREARRRDEPRAQAAHERLRRGLAVVVPPELQHLGVARGPSTKRGPAPNTTAAVSGSACSSATSRPSAARTAGRRHRGHGRCRRRFASAPRRRARRPCSARRSRGSPRGERGTPNDEPGVSESQNAGTVSATAIAEPAAR